MTAAQARALDRPANATGGGDQAILFNSSRSGLNEIYSMNSDGGNQRRLTNNGEIDFNARWSPDKTKIVFVRRVNTNNDFEQIWTMNADGSGQTRLTGPTANVSDHEPSWKPDGTKILFSRCDINFICDLYTMNPDGTNQQPFSGAATPENDEDTAFYAPDGTKIIYSRIPNNTAIPTVGLHTLTENSNNLLRLTSPTTPTADRDPRYSPNGSKIAFVRVPDVIGNTNINGLEIYTMNADGTAQTNITANSFLDNMPIWSPDGTRLAFHSSRDNSVNEIYTMNAANGGAVTRLTFNSANDFLNDWYSVPTTVSRTKFDFDGDGKADQSVFRPSGSYWYALGSQAGFLAADWGAAGDKPAAADYDGDGKTDYAVFRENGLGDPNKSYFFILRSLDNTVQSEQFGRVGDDPSVVGDWDGDGKADAAVFRGGVNAGDPSNFYYHPSSQPGVAFIAVGWGISGDKPVVGDYDGDGKLDAAVFRPSNAVWYVRGSLDGALQATSWGLGSDKPVQADYDGDKKTDTAVYRDGNWYILPSATGVFKAVSWGIAADKPVAADYDGDGKADAAVYRSGNWYILKSSDTQFSAVGFGAASDTPVPSIY